MLARCGLSLWNPTLLIFLLGLLGLIVHDDLAQGTQATEIAIDNLHEASPGNMGHTCLTFLQLVADTLDEVLLCLTTVL